MRVIVKTISQSDLVTIYYLLRPKVEGNSIVSLKILEGNVFTIAQIKEQSICFMYQFSFQKEIVKKLTTGSNCAHLKNFNHILH